MNLNYISLCSSRAVLKLLSIFFGLLVPVCLSAQETGSIKGFLVDYGDNQTVPFANVSIEESESGALVTGCTSDIAGAFIMPSVSAGTYVLRISYLGYQPFSQANVVVVPGEVTDLGTISLVPHLTEIEEVNVVAERPMIEQGVGKTTLNISDNMGAAGESALTLLEFLPSASTDEENNVLLRGSAATIMIDGVETDMANALEAIPISLIDKMEVITNPSAKYSSQNGAGIINIVLKKGKQKGANGKINAGIGTPNKYQGGGNIMLKWNKWTSITNANINRYTDDQDTWSKRITVSKMDTNFLNSIGNTHRIYKNATFRQGFKFQIDKKTSIRLDANFRTGKTDYNGKSESKKYTNDQSLKSHNENTTNGTSEYDYWNTTLNFKKEYSSTTNLGIVVKHENQNNQQPYLREIYHYDITSGDQKKNYSDQTRTNPEDIKSNRLQVDFEHGLNKNYKLETGMLVLQRNSKATNDLVKRKYLYIEEDDTYDVEIDSSQVYQFEIDEVMPSAYALLSMEKNNWFITGGLRYEYAYINSQSPDRDVQVSNDYHNVLPSLQVSKPINKKLTLGFSATMRTKMPKFKQLSPVAVYNGLYSKSVGNPNLRPEKISNIEFTVQRVFKKHTINSSLFYKNQKDMIARHQHIEVEDGNEITVRQYKNIGEVNQLGLELNINSRLPKSIKVKSNLLALGQQIHNTYKGDVVDVNDFYFSGRVTATQTFWKDFRWQLTTIYKSPIKNISGEYYEVFYMNAGLNKSLLKKKGMLSLRVDDVFNTLEKEGINNLSQDHIQHSYQKRISQKVLLSFSYRFNTIASKKK
ncbi:TonB-dependent receptor [Labilibacter sediminis]|nr:TonB-dependent receptor [Labilibacter sediminis]